MSCAEIKKKLTEDLAWRGDSEVRDHLAACSACLECCEDLESLQKLTRELACQLEAPRELHHRVLRRVSGISVMRRWIMRPALAICLLFLTGVVFVWRDNSQEVPAAETTLADHQPIQESAPSDPAYLDIIIENSREEDYILRVPAFIEVRRGQEQEDRFFTNVSH